MALPTSIQPWKDWTRHGIAVAVFPSTQARLGVELQSSTASSLASSQWQSVYMPPSTGGGQMLHTYDTLPMSTRRYYFRARHVGPGVVASSWTPTVSAMPTTLSVIVPIPLVNAVGNVEAPGGHVIVSSGQTVKVGSQNSTSYLTKQIRFTGALFQPRDSTYKFQIHNVTGLSARGTTDTKFFSFAFPFPPGVTLTSVTMAYRRHGVNSTCSLAVYKFSSNGATGVPVASLVGTTSTAAALRTVGTTFTQLISTAIGVAGFLTIKTSQATTDRAQLGWVRMTYRMPSYDRGV